MIKILVLRSNHDLVGFEVKGHAGYDEYGKDIVCAAVSAVAVGGLNAVAHYYHNDLSRFQAEMKEGYTFLKIFDKNEQKIQTVLETLVIQFRTIEETYSKYIQVMEQEVHSQ